MYYVYVIQSESNGRYYIGSTEDIQKRIQYHNNNSNLSTKNKGPWKLVYIETLPSKTEALRREKIVKSYKGGNSFKILIKPTSASR